MKFTAAGDFLAQTRVPMNKEFEGVRDFVSKGDARFVNLETTVFKVGTPGIYASQFNGGSYLRIDPTVFDDMKAYGFNMTSYSNNHSFDFGMAGMISTYNEVKKSGLVSAGAGMDLDEAAAPAYLDTPNGRVAIIAADSSSSNESVFAGKSSKYFKGRPGINVLRPVERIQLDHETFKAFSEAVSKGGANTAQEISRSEGYTKPEKPGEFTVNRKMVFVEGDEPGMISRPNEADMNRILAAIDEAKRNADFVVISIHAHAVGGTCKEDVVDFMKIFAHNCIDRGADAILGHGPHILRGIEVYKNRPIFYSLGDFILQNEYGTVAPADFFEKYGGPVDSDMEQMFLKRDDYGKRGLRYNFKANESVVANFEIENGVLKYVDLLPIELGMGDISRKGCPGPCFDKGIIERLAGLSKPFGTEITIDESGIGHVAL